jgi:hypothetical protein
MFDIVQNLAKELTAIKSRLIVPNQVSAVLRRPVEYEEEEESDGDEESEDGDEESEDESDNGESDDGEDEDKVKVIELGELSSMDNIDEPSSESDTEIESDMVELNEHDSDKIQVLKVSSLESVEAPPVIAVPDNNSEIFKKMSVGELRTLAISKGLCSDASKLNKVELVKMLSKKIM